MKKLTVIFLLMATAAIYAQDNLTQTSINGMLTYNQGQVIQLAQAFSEEQYDWRPTDGVVSVREALLHVASANYYLTSKLGFAPPENVDMMKIGEITGRDNVIAALKQSNEFVLENIIKIGTSKLADEVDLGFAKMNTLSVLLQIMEHNGEHKGQLIAYARSNGVVPPWSE